MIDKHKALILVVDDNPQNLQVLGNMLAENGYEVGVADNGEDALAFISNTMPDLILLDIVMPGLDGYEVCKRLKAAPFTRHIPVIFISAKTEQESIVKGFEVGGGDYVTKPFNSAELLARVQIHIEIKTLRSIMAVCAACKKIRDDHGHWEKLEIYALKHLDTDVSHSICPDCAQELYPDYFSDSEDLD